VPEPSTPSRSLRRLFGWLTQSRPGGEPVRAGPTALPAYVALGHWAPRRAALDIRLELLVGELSAELSMCQWCIAQSRHRWLKAFLPMDLLRQLRTYETSPAFTERERAALALAEAVARHSDRDPVAQGPALERARCYFEEAEVARLAAAGAGEHFFDPATGTIGRDALASSLSPSAGAMPWHAIDRGIAIRGLY
jgi:alkylhydroperoxidase family enzyme